jgi:hypothetical protein
MRALLLQQKPSYQSYKLSLIKMMKQVRKYYKRSKHVSKPKKTAMKS